MAQYSKNQVKKISALQKLKNWWQNRHPVMNFFLRFLGFATLILALRFIFSQSLYLKLIESNGILGGWIINLMGGNVSVADSTISSSEFAMSVVNGCDATDAVIIFAAIVLAFPTKWKYRIQGAIIGSASLLFINLFRIVALYYIGVYWHDWFELFHIEIFQFLFILLALILAAVWIRWINRKEGFNLQNEKKENS